MTISSFCQTFSSVLSLSSHCVWSSVPEFSTQTCQTSLYLPFAFIHSFDPPLALASVSSASTRHVSDFLRLWLASNPSLRLPPSLPSLSSLVLTGLFRACYFLYSESGYCMLTWINGQALEYRWYRLFWIPALQRPLRQPVRSSTPTHRS